jgi:hypothetical protein
VAMNKAQRRYNRSVLIACSGYAITLFAVVAFARTHPLSGVSGGAIAILPALPIIAVFWIMWRYLGEESDEYLRYMFTRQALVATGFVLSIATAWGFLENFGVVPHVYAFYAAIIWFAGLGVGSCVNRLFRGREA